MKKLIKSEQEWKNFLTPKQFNILRQRGTEPAFAKNNFYYNKEKGKYFCIACNNLLFLSEDKYDSGTGWPSFTKPASKSSIEFGSGSLVEGKEVHCARCSGHLGHIFNDGPAPERLRFCINGLILKFKKTNKF